MIVHFLEGPSICLYLKQVNYSFLSSSNLCVPLRSKPCHLWLNQLKLPQANASNSKSVKFPLITFQYFDSLRVFTSYRVPYCYSHGLLWAMGKNWYVFSWPILCLSEKRDTSPSGNSPPLLSSREDLVIAEGVDLEMTFSWPLVTLSGGHDLWALRYVPPAKWLAVSEWIWSKL